MGFLFSLLKVRAKALVASSNATGFKQRVIHGKEEIEPKIKDEKDCWLQLYKIHVQAAKLRQLQLYKLCRSDSVCLSLCLCVCVNPVCVL